MFKRLRKTFLGKDDDETANGIHNQHSVSCNSCGSERFQIDRYKCLICGDYNLCAQCFEERLHTNEHSTGHPMLHFKFPNELFGRKVKPKDVNTMERIEHVYSNVQHDGIACNKCMVQPIHGLRFKCDTCPNFNLCQTCAITNSNINQHNSNHPLVLVSQQIIEKLNMKDIKIGDVLGKGAFGTVYKGEWSSNSVRRQVACKELYIPVGVDAEQLEKSFFRELSAYAEVGGPNILKVFGYYFDRKENGPTRFFLITEYMTKGSLSNVIYNTQQQERLSWNRKLCIACNIASGMRKIHQHLIIHRDIRPDNILVTDNYLAKIADMGIARNLDSYLQHTQIGCMRYMPPEFYTTGIYDQKLDVYTFGLSLNELLTEKPHQFITNQIKLTATSPIFSDLIERCLEQDPIYRPTAAEIEATLILHKNEFNSRISWDLTYSQLSLEEKNKVFIKFYDQYHPEAVRLIEKQFPPINKSSLLDVSAGGEEDDKSHTKCIKCRCIIQ